MAHMNRPTGDYKTVSIRRSWPVVSADGKTGILLETQELGMLAIHLPPEGIAVLRKTLSELEAMQSQGIGNA